MSSKKQSYFIQMTDTDPFSFAGVKSFWISWDNIIESYAIITTIAYDYLSMIHDRMQVFIGQDNYDT